MPPPKALTGELAELFSKLASKLEARTGPLTPAATEQLQRLAPHELVALDQALEQGAKLGEVSGTGVGVKGPLTHQFGFEPNSNVMMRRTDTVPNAGDAPVLWETARGQPNRDIWQTFETGHGPAEYRDLDPVDDPFTAQAVADDASGRILETDAINKEQNLKREWPQAWRDWENIPGVVLGVGTGAALLGASKAQAAAPQNDGDWETVNQSADDGWETVSAPAASAAPTPDPLVGGMSVGAPKPDPGKFEHHVTSFSEMGNALGATAAGGWRAIKAAFAPAQAFKNDYIDPVMRLFQQRQQEAWLGKAERPATPEELGKLPTWAQLGVEAATLHLPGPTDAAGAMDRPGQRLRGGDPTRAFVLENATKLALGETGWNTKDETRLSKEVTQVGGVFDQLKARYGETGAGIVHAMANGLYGDLPIALIPGVGEGAAMQGASAGLLTALAEPGADLATSTVAGGVVGKGLEAGLSAAKGGYSLVKKAVSKEAKPIFDPIGVVTPSDVDNLAAKVSREVETSAVPSKELPPDTIAVAVDVGPDGKKVAKALVHVPNEAPAAELPGKLTNPGKGQKVGPNGTNASRRMMAVEVPLPVAQKAAAQGKTELLPTAEARAVDPVQGYDDLPAPTPTFDHGTIIDLTEPLGTLPGGMAPRKAIAGGDVHEGKVLVIEGGMGGGTARLYDIQSPKLQREVLKARGVAEVTLPDGRRVVGYLSPGERSEAILVPPDADELIPRAATEFHEFSKAEWEQMQKSGKVNTLNDSAVDDLLLERERLKLDAEEQRAAAEANARVVQEDLSAGGDGSGKKLPPPPPDDPPPPPPPNPHNVDPSEAPKLSYFQKLWNSGMRLLVHPTARGPLEVADLARDQAGVKTMETLRPEIEQSLRQTVPEMANMTPQQLAEIHHGMNEFLQGNLTLEQLRDRHPELNREIYRRLEIEKTQTALDEQRLIQNGQLSPGESLEDAGLTAGRDEDYVTRMYWRHYLPDGEWAKMAKRDAVGMAALKDAILTDVYSKGKYAQMSKAQREALAQRHLDFLLGDPEALKLDLKENGKSGGLAAAYSSLKSRADSAWLKAKAEVQTALDKATDPKDIARLQKELTRLKNDVPAGARWWEKAALGEIDDAFVRIAETRTRQRQLVMIGDIWRQVASQPHMAVPVEQAAPWQIAGKDAWVQLPNDAVSRRTFGNAAGMYVRPDVADSLIELPRILRNLQGTQSKLVSNLKWAQTVGNPGSWVRNFMGNAQNMALSNLVDPFAQPLTVGRGMLQFGKDFEAHMKLPGVTVQKGDLGQRRWRRAMELGVVGSDYNSAEFRESATEWARKFSDEAKMNGGRVNALDVMADTVKALKGGKQELSRKYGAIDTIWKYSAYVGGLEKAGVDLATNKVDVALAEKFLKGTGREYPGLYDDQAALLTAVEKEISKRIHYSFPMMDRVGVIPAALGKMAGVVNPYIKIKTELMRNYASIPGRMLAEPGMTANMMRLTAYAGAGFMGLKAIRQANGVGQDQVDAAWASAPPHMQQLKPGATALWFRDSKGRVQFVDMAPFFEPMSYVSGNTEAPWLANVLQNIAVSPVDGSLLDRPTAQFLAAGGLAEPAYADPKTPKWQADGANLLRKSAEVVAPGLAKNVYRGMVNGEIGFSERGVKGPGRDAQSPGNAAVQMVMGQSTFAYGNARDYRAALKTAADEINARAAELKALGPMNEGQSTGMFSRPLDRQAAFAKARAALDDAKRKYEALRQKLGTQE